MKINKHLVTIAFISCMMFALNGILHANEEKNKYIDEYPPVFTSHFTYKIEEESTLYNPDLPYSSDVVGSFDLGLINPASNKYNLYVVKERLLGFSKNDSQIQVYGKDASIFSIGSKGEPFGESIPLIPGTYTVEGKVKGLGSFRVTVVIEKSQLDIKEAKSGWTRYDTTYAPADIYRVQIKNVERIKS